MQGIINLIYMLYHFIADIQLRGDPTECKLYLATLSSLVSNNVTLLVPHNHGSFQSVDTDHKRSQKNILKLLKHKQRLSKLKTQISSWSQHEIEDLWNAGLCCRSPAF